MIIVGQKYNMLTIVGLQQIGRRKYAECVCDCGKSFVFKRTDKIEAGKQKSCGCLMKAKGFIGTQEYNSWRKMKDRCKGHSPHHVKFYKEKGITVCERWATSFENFLADMGKAPSIKHSLDRINSNGNYEPSNCKWSTKEEQMRNIRSNVYLEYKGETMIMKDWCRKLGIAYTVTCTLVKHSGLPFDKIVEMQLNRKRKNTA